MSSPLCDEAAVSAVSSARRPKCWRLYTSSNCVNQKFSNTLTDEPRNPRFESSRCSAFKSLNSRRIWPSILNNTRTQRSSALFQERGWFSVPGCWANSEMTEIATPILRSRKNYAGTSPITRASGGSKVVLARHACNKRLVDARNQWAICSLRMSSGACRYYDELRARDKTHSVTIRQVANRWVGVLTRPPRKWLSLQRRDCLVEAARSRYAHQMTPPCLDRRQCRSLEQECHDRRWEGPSQIIGVQYCSRRYDARRKETFDGPRPCTPTR